jgi:hypothetical protein
MGLNEQISLYLSFEIKIRFLSIEQNHDLFLRFPKQRIGILHLLKLNTTVVVLYL